MHLDTVESVCLVNELGGVGGVGQVGLGELVAVLLVFVAECLGGVETHCQRVGDFELVELENLHVLVDGLELCLLLVLEVEVLELRQRHVAAVDGHYCRLFGPEHEHASQEHDGAEGGYQSFLHM